MKTPRNPATIHPPLGLYSHQIELQEPGRWVVMAGQVGRMRDGTLPSDPIEQLSVALENVRHNLEAAGLGVQDVVKVTWYLVGEIDDARRREVIAGWLGEHRPTSTLIYVAALVAPEYRVEVDVWAFAPEPARS
ncbi:MAG TPA: RidA family protein [Candidatus Dormibacteraeota bacterium]|nr:RidA family protein [Candidatus Dormibacteraeota bacterium]